jgi:hypothetical protein
LLLLQMSRIDLGNVFFDPDARAEHQF